MPEIDEKQTPEITSNMVVEYLQKHPNFLTENLALLEALIPPEQNHGRGVIDFQFHAIDHLRNDSAKLKSRFQNLITSAQDNLSVQQQVHKAVKALVIARSAEQLLEAITTDLAHLFGVDVVRLALESDVAGLYDTYYPEQHFSGICFVPSGTSKAAMLQADVRLISDTQQEPPIGFEMIFADCSNLVRSAALLKLDLTKTGKVAMLAFGVRHTDHFQPHQADDLLRFLADIAAIKLDDLLEREDFLN
jgi:uncharacterized protein YigA (DUF484 family)